MNWRKLPYGRGLTAEIATDLGDAIDKVRERIDAETGHGKQILFCGSLYLVGEVLAFNQTPPS